MRRSEIVEGLRKKDERALSFLYDQYSQLLLGLIIRIIGDREAAEEVLQQTMLKVWNSAGSFDEQKGPLFSWISAIARNTALDRGRLRSFQNTQKTDPLDTTVYTSKIVNTETASIDAEQLTAKLDNKYKEVLDLVYLMGYTHQEASELLEIPLGTVKTRIRQAIKTLGEELKNEKGLFMGILIIAMIIILIT